MSVSPAIDEAQLEAIVPAFYARVRTDPLIGPVFDDAIEDWSVHLEKLVAFWSSVMLTSGRYKGNPMIAHLKHVGVLTPEMFDRWLALWKDVTEEQLPGDVAAALQHKAGRIAESLKLALWFRLPKNPAPSAAQPTSMGA
ncbi:MAG: group III truncated hemoglobin [Pseudomonadota bacterium]|nr:group III truncated hemoglobin [Pseudomonadota bacterium]